MNAAGLLTVVRLFFLFILSVTLPLVGHCAAYTSLLSWAGWGSSSKSIETWEDRSGEISKLSFRGNKQAEKNESGHSDDKSRFSGPLAIPGAPVTADNGEPFTSSSGGGFGSGDDLDDL
ncbi:hypothetical protein, partial [Endozoicomonas sp. ONNA1]|uniref:hypothetical protein n=1 Tax=Endozoicomonas sp. ONNA1 TaxID=2828740 RepID=UPI0021490646